MKVLTGIDLLGIQSYIFTSNRLRDVISASLLVYSATSRDGGLRACPGDQVLQAGGGKAVLAFESLAEARQFAARYTRDLLENAPRLEAVIAHCSTDGGFAEALRELQVILARKKLERSPDASALGLAVTAACQVTGLPACTVDSLDRAPVCRQVEIWRRDDIRREAETRWQTYLPESSGWMFPAEIDELGRTWNDTSLFAVVYLDANDVGERIRDWLERCTSSSLDSAGIRAEYREWSEWLDQQLQRVWRSIVGRVTAAIHDCTVEGSTPGLRFELSPKKLPLRPVLLGGDDFTFLCDGRIALDLAATALREFSSGDCPHMGKMSACAGVAIVRAHYPFARAYELAEKLCGHAKAARKKRGDEGCWIDWNIGGTRPGEPIAELRARAYRAPNLDLTCRPYRLGTPSNEPETWNWLSGTMLGTSGNGLRGPQWGQRRNKVKELGALAREGPDTVRGTLKAWQGVNPNLALPDGLTDSGFLGDRTPLLDATELLDLHLPLGREL